MSEVQTKIICENFDELHYQVMTYVDENILFQYFNDEAGEYKFDEANKVMEELETFLLRLDVNPQIENIQATTIQDWFANPFVNEYDKQQCLDKILAENKTLNRL